jgi:hypothetical protein
MFLQVFSGRSVNPAVNFYKSNAVLSFEVYCNPKGLCGVSAIEYSSHKIIKRKNGKQR